MNEHFLRKIEDMKPTEIIERWRWVCGCGAVGPTTMSDRTSRLDFQRHRKLAKRPVISDQRTLIHSYWQAG